MSTPSTSLRIARTRSLSGIFSCALLGLLSCTGTVVDPQSHGANADSTGGNNSSAAGGGDNTPKDTGGTVGSSGGSSSTNGGGNTLGNGGAGTTNAGGSAGTAPRSAFACSTSSVDPGPTAMRLLDRTQYLNSLRDLLGDITGIDAALPATTGPSAYGLVPGDVAQVDLEGYQKAAETIALSVTTDKTRLDAIAPCASGANARTCASTFFKNAGVRAYRAPITDAADTERHLKLFDVGASKSYAHGIELLLRGMLQSPRFLYRVEIGTGEAVGTNAVKLSGYERAARLSYALWDTLPDTKLNQAAASGALDTPAGVAAQLDWMLADAKGKTTLRRFLEGWTQMAALDSAVKTSDTAPTWASGTLRASLRAQAQNFFDYILQSQKGELRALLTSSSVFVNTDLGGYYGVTGGKSFTRLDVSDGSVSGMLTLPGLLARLAKPDESSPVYRGRFVREALLCQQLPSPPANVPKPPTVEPNVSTRERLKQHEVDPSCSGCHKLIDPIGLGFENYDAVGRYRTSDGGKPVDASGNLTGTDVDGAFNGVPELAARLSDSNIVRECVARQWFRFVLGRFEQGVDGCSMKHISDAFVNSNASFNSLPQAVVESDAFLYRRTIKTGASQ